MKRLLAVTILLILIIVLAWPQIALCVLEKGATTENNFLRPLPVSQRNPAMSADAIKSEIRNRVKDLEAIEPTEERFDPTEEVIDNLIAIIGIDNLVAWRQKPEEAQTVSAGDHARIEESITRQIGDTIKENFDFDGGYYDLESIAKVKRAQCVGFSQLFYIIGTSIGLKVQPINVIKAVYGLLPPGEGHFASIVRLANGKIIMVDLVPSGFISGSFDLEEVFNKEGRFYALRDSANPLNLHRIIRLIDMNGLSASIYIHRAATIDDLALLRPGDGDTEFYQQALRYCGVAEGKDPLNEGIYLTRGCIFVHMGLFSHALENYNHAIELQPENYTAYFNRASTFTKLKRYKEAVADYLECIRLYPKYVEAYYNLGRLYLINLQNSHEAVECFSRAIAIDSSRAEAYVNRGIAHATLEQTGNAIADLQMALNLNPDLGDRIELICRQFRLPFPQTGNVNSALETLSFI